MLAVPAESPLALSLAAGGLAFGLIWLMSRRRDAQIFAYLAHEVVNDFGMAGNGGTPALDGVGPPRMLASLAEEDATMRPEVLEEGNALHSTSSTSVKSGAAALTASSRLNSSASRRAERKLSRSSSWVRS